MPASSWKLAPGLNNVGSYQASGKPFATGSLDCEVTPVEVVFPNVSSWIYVINNDGANPCRVGFSISGVTGSFNFITVGPLGSTPTLDLKVSAVWVSGSSNVDIMAGLTGIPAYQTRTADGPNWSGSSGVG